MIEGRERRTKGQEAKNDFGEKIFWFLFGFCLAKPMWAKKAPKHWKTSFFLFSVVLRFFSVLVFQTQQKQ